MTFHRTRNHWCWIGWYGLGQLVAPALAKRGVAVKALVRPNTDSSRTEKLRNAGVMITPIDLGAVPALTKELTGAICAVSTLQGLRDIHPFRLFLDFTKTKVGSNCNLDLRREFHTKLTKSGIAWTSILKGGFMDLMVGDSPMINHKGRKVAYIGSTTQLLDFTTMVDTAAYTAAVAAAPNPTPNFLRIASATVNIEDIAQAQTTVEGVKYKPNWIGTVGSMEFMIQKAWQQTVQSLGTNQSCSMG
ncbi:unnamed protein product [Penicillium discolor]